ncbi:MAG: hypothetical protein MJ238_05990 [Bacilli bacterium]|nr:hypothetical protein [Bacilli bacterium]
MSRPKYINLFLSCVLISSCSIKSVTLAEAITIYQEICKKLEDSENEPQTALTTKACYSEERENGCKVEIKLYGYHDANGETFYLNKHLYEKTSKGTSEGDFEAWSWKDAEKYYYATRSKFGDEETLCWRYTNTLMTNNLGLENYLDLSLNIAKENSELSSESLKAKFGDDVKWSFQSSGRGSLSSVISGKIKDESIQEKIHYEDFLLREYFYVRRNITEQYTFDHKKSKFEKPDISLFEFVDSIEK